MNYRSIQDLNIVINKNIAKLKFEKFDLIVGIPRSGMLPASIIALKLNLPLMSINEFLENKIIVHGLTRKPSTEINTAHDAKKILIIDDSVSSGRSIADVKDKMPQNLLKISKFLAVYGVNKHADVDFVLEVVKSPRFFEWNALYHSIVQTACFDIDGVLCEDPTEEQNDDGDNYLLFLTNAKPLYIPLLEIDTLVTNRLEKYRLQTELWLSKYNIKYKRLEMLNLDSKEERLAQLDYFEHKAKIYKQSNANIFYESSLQQAKVIFERTQKPVYCVDEHILITPSIINTLFKRTTAKLFIKERLYEFKVVRYLHKLIKN